MIEKEFVIEFLFKEKMMQKSLPELKKHLENILQNNKISNQSFLYYKIKDALSVINKLLKMDVDKFDFDYYDAFVLTLAFAYEFTELKKSLLSDEEGSFKLETNFYKENYWRENETVDFNEGLFLTYTFLNETYKTQLSIDFKKLLEAMDRIDK